MKCIMVLLMVCSFIHGSYAQVPELVLPLGHTDEITKADITPDGRLLVTASSDGTGKIWNYRTAKLIHNLALHTRSVVDMVISSDGSFVVLGSSDGTYSQWSTSTGKLMYHSKPTAAIENFFLLPGDSVLIVQKSQTMVRSYFTDDKEDELFADNNAHLIKLFSASPDKKIIALYIQNGTSHEIVFYSAEDGSIINSINELSFNESHYDLSQLEPKKVVFINNHEAAIHFENIFTVVFDLGTGAFSYMNNQWATDIEGSHTGRFIAVQNNKGNSIEVWNLETKGLVGSISHPDASVGICSFSASDSSIFINGSNGQLEEWSFTGVKLREMPISGEQYFLDYRPGHNAFIYQGGTTYGNKGTINIWSSTSGKFINEFSGKIATVLATTISRDGQYIFEIKSKYASYWHIKNAGNVRFPQLGDQVVEVIHLTNNVEKVILQYRRSFALFDLTEKRFLYKQDQDFQFELTMLSGDSLFVTLGNNNEVVQWNTLTGKRVKQITLPYSLSKITVSQNHELLAGLVRETNNDTIEVWSFLTGARVAAIPRLGQEVKSLWGISNYYPNYTPVVQFSDKGDYIFYNIGENGTITGARLPVWDYISEEDSVYDDSTPELNYLPNGYLSQYYPILKLPGTSVILYCEFEPHTLKKIIGYDYEKDDRLYELAYPQSQRILYFNSERNWLYTATNKELLVWSLLTKKIVKKYTLPPGLDAESFNPGTNQLLIKANDRVGIMNLDGKKPVYYLSTLNSGDFIAFRSDRYYMATPGAARWLLWKVNNKYYDFAQWDIQYNRPDKVIEIMDDGAKTLAGAYYNAYLKRLKRTGLNEKMFSKNFQVPTTEILNLLEQGSLVESPVFELSIKCLDADSRSGLKSILVTVNDVPISGKNGMAVGNRQSDSIFSISVTLSEGPNNIRVSCINNKAVESVRQQIMLNYKSIKPVKERVSFVGIGIDHFADDRYNLQYSAKDIRDVALKLKEKYGDTIDIDTLFNENVSLGNIKALKQKLLRTTENDKVIIAYSGHGMLTKEYDYYLSTYAVNFDRPEENGLPYEELENLLDSIPARKKLMLIDACHSGEVDKDDMMVENNKADSSGLKKGEKGFKLMKTKTAGLKNSFELMQSLFVNLGNSTGSTVISAASGTQFALERNDLENGVFTYAILELMKNSPTITVSELRRIVGERVSELTKGLQQPTSRNENKTVDWNVW